MSIRVRHNRDDQQFEAEVSGGTALISYNEGEGVITFVHTEVPVEAEGQGVAKALVLDALQYARDNRLQVVPECEYVASYVKRHREYDDLVHPDYRADS